MGSPRCVSSSLAREEEQKSKEERTAAASLSLESVSLSFACSGAATPETAEQKRKLDSEMWTMRWAKEFCVAVGLKENFSAGMASAAAVMILLLRARDWRRASATGLADGAGA